MLADTVSANEASLEGLIHLRVEGVIPDAKPGTESGAGLVAIRWTRPEMGWARCGRGGTPASAKNGMNPHSGDGAQAALWGSPAHPLADGAGVRGCISHLGGAMSVPQTQEPLKSREGATADPPRFEVPGRFMAIRHSPNLDAGIDQSITPPDLDATRLICASRSEV